MKPANTHTALGLPVVYLVDDEDVVRDALGWLLRTCRIVSEGFASAEAFDAMLAALPTSVRSDWPAFPACLLLDVRLPGTSGLALFERLVDRGLVDRLPVIFLTGHADVPTAVHAVKRGAFDFVEKPFSDNALVERVREALDHSSAAIIRYRRRLALQRRLQSLTERERKVMEHVVGGLSNKQIADLLQISVRTVEVHRARVFEKMEAGSAVDLANLLADAELR